MAQARKTSFKKGAAKETPVEEAEVVGNDNTEIVESGGSYLPSTSGEGEYEQSDLVYPRLGTMHKTSKLVESDDEDTPAAFKFLDVVVNNEVRVANPNNAAKIVVLAFRKVWEENIPWGSDEKARTFPTKAAAIAAGLSVEWGDSGNKDEDEPGAKPKLTALAMVKFPEHAVGRADEDDEDMDLSVNFPYAFEKEDHPEGAESEFGQYAVVLWEMGGSAYNSTAKPIITANQTATVAGHIEKCVWSLKTRKKVFAGNTFTQHVFKRTGSTSEAFQKWAKSLL
jgi:hypothetical protein